MLNNVKNSQQIDDILYCLGKLNKNKMIMEMTWNTKRLYKREKSYYEVVESDGIC